MIDVGSAPSILTLFSQVLPSSHVYSIVSGMPCVSTGAPNSEKSQASTTLTRK